MTLYSISSVTNRQTNIQTLRSYIRTSVIRTEVEYPIKNPTLNEIYTKTAAQAKSKVSLAFRSTRSLRLWYSSRLISNQGNSANTDSIRQAKEVRFYPWNKQTNKLTEIEYSIKKSNIKWNLYKNSSTSQIKSFPCVSFDALAEITEQLSCTKPHTSKLENFFITLLSSFTTYLFFADIYFIKIKRAVACTLTNYSVA